MTKPSKKEQLQIINALKDKIKDSDVVKDMFKDYGIDVAELDLVPVCFSDLDVSARTAHGCIYLNNKLLDNLMENDHYLVHELSHYLQQTSGDGPTQGADDGDYLSNPYEQEGFQNQTEYISDQHGDQAAEKYIDKVLDHHDVPNDEKEDKKDDLLALAETYYKYIILH